MKFWVEELETDSERGLFIRRNVTVTSPHGGQSSPWPTSVAMMINRSGESQQLANLFAAAPEMLSILEEILIESVCGCDRELEKRIENLIKKAKGEK